MVHVESFNFDIGVKNTKKNRLVVNSIHLLNEILFNIEKTSKPNFQVSIVSYVNNKSNPLSFFNVKRDLEIDGLDKAFNFYINRKGNVITNVEMNDVNYFYPDMENKTNVVICLSGFTTNSDNSNAHDLYSPQQVTTLSKMLETFTFNTKSTTFEDLDVPKDLAKITSAGFDIGEFLKEIGLG